MVDQLNGVNESFHYIMDQEFWLRAGINGFKYKYLKGKVFANFRLIKGTKTFDMGPEFNEEWHGYTLKLLSAPYFDFLSANKKRSIVNNSFSKLYLSKMLHAIEKNNKFKIIKYCCLSIKSDPKIALNRGMWKFLIFGLIGIKVDRLKKFRLNEEDYIKGNA